MAEQEPEVCKVCGQFRTADARYAGRRCTCPGSPLEQFYLSACLRCSRHSCFGCTAEAAASRAPVERQAVSPGEKVR